MKKKTQKNTDIHKQIHLFRSINIRNSKIAMQEFWYDKVKPKY